MYSILLDSRNVCLNRKYVGLPLHVTHTEDMGDLHVHVSAIHVRVNGNCNFLHSIVMVEVFNHFLLILMTIILLAMLLIIS